MKPPFLNSIPLRSRCLKAALLLIALGLAAICALFTPADAQSVQSMVKQQPFPYAQGVAMDTLLYKSVKAKLLAAEALKAASAQTILTLQTEISATKLALADQKKLGGYDARKADSLRNVAHVLDAQLKTATSQFNQAAQALKTIFNYLPPSLRQQHRFDTPEQLASAVTEYIRLLQVRKWKWAGVSVVLGGLGSLIAILR